VVMNEHCESRASLTDIRPSRRKFRERFSEGWSKVT